MTVLAILCFEITLNETNVLKHVQNSLEGRQSKQGYAKVGAILRAHEAQSF